MNAADFLRTNSLLGDRVRLAIMASLAAAPDALDFPTLVESLGVTRGNLSGHIQKLEEGGLIRVTKEFIGRKPRTSYVCTNLGLQEVREYLKQVERLLTSAGK